MDRSFQITKKKIQLLLEELRSWEPGEMRWSLRDLVLMFELEPFVIQQIAHSDGMELAPVEETEESPVDPNAITLDLEPDEVREALEKPDPNYPDQDTGIWKKPK